jgi:archaellum component FlaC
MEQRIDRIEKAIEEMVSGYKRHDKILINLEANQIVMGKAMEGIREDVHGIREEVKGIKNEVSRFVSVVSDFMDAVGYKFKDHEERIKKLEDK